MNAMTNDEEIRFNALYVMLHAELAEQNNIKVTHNDRNDNLMNIGKYINIDFEHKQFFKYSIALAKTPFDLDLGLVLSEGMLIDMKIGNDKKVKLFGGKALSSSTNAKPHQIAYFPFLNETHQLICDFVSMSLAGAKVFYTWIEDHAANDIKRMLKTLYNENDISEIGLGLYGSQYKPMLTYTQDPEAFNNYSFFFVDKRSKLIFNVTYKKDPDTKESSFKIMNVIESTKDIPDKDVIHQSKVVNTLNVIENL